MKIAFVTALISVQLLTACFYRKPFQPNPYEYERWSRPGDDQLDVRKAMLECGYPSPNGVRDRMINAEATPEEIALMYMCMESNGYLYDGKAHDVCRSGYSSVRACRLEESPPKRDVTKRLNGRFCQVFPSADVCR
jgi:hypothetical protein